MMRKDILKDQGVNRRIILKLILKERDVRVWAEFSCQVMVQ
jgi:hypothetical protein